MKLSVVLARIYEDQSASRPVPLDPDGPEPSRIQKVIMLRLLNQDGKFGELPLRSDISRERGLEFGEEFASSLWLETMKMSATIATILRSAIQKLEESGERPTSSARRAVRDSLTAWVMDCRKHGGGSISTDQMQELARQVIVRVKHYEWEPIDPREFEATFGPGYSGLAWEAFTERPEGLMLGTLDRPPLSDPSRRRVEVGTDRDGYSRYESYYRLRAHSRTAAPVLDHRIRTSSPMAVAEHELRRMTRPLGLAHADHRQALVVAFYNLDSSVLAQNESQSSSSRMTTERSPEVDAAPLGDQIVLSGRLMAVWVGFARRYRHNGWVRDLDFDGVQRRVMRRLWNDLHRFERETESLATVGWFVSQFSRALKSLIQNPVSSPTGGRRAYDDARDGARDELDNRNEPGLDPVDNEVAAPQQLTAQLTADLRFALKTLAELDPLQILSWTMALQGDDALVVTEIRAGLSERLEDTARVERTASVIIRLLTGLGRDAR